ncbi:MAG: hypothetical protein DHS20C18_06410 [Saprospiraceae bacterium]|nr:MAG: hypothetical protein DHS20C18_06410 [Saprospiraceae bacterium]
MFVVAEAHINPEVENRPINNGNTDQESNTVSYRDNCDNAVSQMDQAINNVRARLTTGGDAWWDGNDGRYVVPKVPAGATEVSSIFAGAVWLGGLDDGNALKVAAQTYGRGSGNFDFWPGPLVPEGPDQGTVEKETCSKWDMFFTVSRKDIDEHIRRHQEAVEQGVPYTDIPRSVRGWPATGNEFFFDVHEFDLPNTSQGLAGFFDLDGDDEYNPDRGDFPIIEIRGCDKPQYGDEMTFWVYNDAGNTHAESNSPNKIRMEVQVQAFAYSTNDEINNMTFQRYKLINRALESIDSTFFAMWVDPDLGCYTDDYIGCDVEASLAYVYNEDAIDGTTGCNCEQGVNTYCDEVPILGVDYFRGPLDEFGNELGMSSFTYYNNGSVGSPAPGTTDPANETEYYNYISGSWKDGSPFTYGDDAYQDGAPIDYAFTEAPDNPNGWSMCTANLPFGDRRTVQASGPFRLDPGAVNELIVGVVWVADQAYPCPSIKKLKEADDIAQGLFDNCFDILDGPDAPDVDFIELDREIIAVFTNNGTSNNINEEYEENLLLDVPPGLDSTYNFEGYKLYQMSSADIDLSPENLEDPTKVRQIYQVDVKNNVSKIFNWETLSEPGDTPTEEEYFVPELQVDGENKGIRHTFQIKEDQFADGDRRLINHKKYYFIAIAYGHNEYTAFDPVAVLGQRRAYIIGRNNIGPESDGKPYTTIPRPIVDRTLKSAYSDGAVITRVDGLGTGNNFLDISDESRVAIEESFKDGGASFSGEITYRPGRGPIELAIYNPLDVVDGEFELKFTDNNPNDNTLGVNATWQLSSLTDPSAPVIVSENPISSFNQQIVSQYGFSVAIGQVAEPGSEQFIDPTNGLIGYEEEYAGGEDATPWLFGVSDGFTPSEGPLSNNIFDYLVTDPGERDEELDPEQAFSKVGPGYFTPYFLANWTTSGATLPYITPAWTNGSNGNNIVRTQLRANGGLGTLNNVDIVMTSNKELWSRCVVIETANTFYINGGFPTDPGTTNQGTNHFDVRKAPSVTKDDNDQDGLPDIDTSEPRTGFGWFPGYAVDVETGQRLNIFFGENTVYDGTFFPETYNSAPTGRDMMFNPSSQMELNLVGLTDLYQFYAGGQHFVYVTGTPYDGCEALSERLVASPQALLKVKAVKEITWAGLVMPLRETPFKSYADGLIPNDVRVKLRVNNPYQVEVDNDETQGFDDRTGTGVNAYHPAYRFKLEGKQAEALNEETLETALDLINMVPNPYYGFSDYEQSQFETTVKITNLPAKCVVNIYSLDGKFIRRYNRDELGSNAKGSGISRNQILPDLEWDLKNSKGIPIASGVYLIHVSAEGLGERTLKWFGVNRQFDASGL